MYKEHDVRIDSDEVEVDIRKRFREDKAVDDELTTKYTKNLRMMEVIAKERLSHFHQKYDDFPEIDINFQEVIDQAKQNVRNNLDLKATLRAGKMMYPEGIRTAFNIYERMYLNRETRIVAFGGTTLGKTSNSHFFRFLVGPLNLQFLRRETAIANVYIPKRAVIAQANASFSALMCLYGRIRFGLIGEPPEDYVLIERYHHRIAGQFAREPLYRKYNLESRIKDSEIVAGSQNDAILNQSRTRAEIDRISAFATAHGMDLLTIIDEVHHAPREEGLLGKRMKNLDPDYKINVLNELGQSTSRHMLAYSATPDTNLLQPWILEQMLHGPDYASAFTYFLGRPITSRPALLVEGLTAFYDRSGVDLKLIDVNVLNHKDGRPDDYARECWSLMLEAIEWCFENNFRPHKGAFIRLERRNDNCKKFAAFIREQTKYTDRSIHVIEFYGSDNKDSMQSQLEYLIENDLYFIVLATAGCRMADDLPRQVCYLFDLTAKTSHVNVLRQGTPGRGAGHFKVSYIILSDVNAQMVADDNVNEGYPIKSPGRHVYMNDDNGLRSYAGRLVQARVDVPRNSPMAILLTPFQKALEEQALRKCGMIPITRPLPSGLSLELDTVLRDTVLKATALGPLRAMLIEPTLKRYNLESVELLGLNGDEMPLDVKPRKTGPKYRYFYGDHPYSFRDRSLIDANSRKGRTKTDKSIHNMRAKSWRDGGGMLIQIVWDIVDQHDIGVVDGEIGTLRITEIIWPVKAFKRARPRAAKDTPSPRDYTWQFQTTKRHETVK